MANCDKIRARNSKISLLSTAFNEVFDEFYIKFKIQFDIAIINSHLSDVNTLNEFLSQLKEENSYKLKFWEPDSKVGILRSTVFSVTSCEDYALVHQNVKLENKFPNNLKFFFYVENCGFKIFQNNLKYLIRKVNFYSGRLEIFEFLLINDGNFLHLATIEWFTEITCNQPQLIVLNSFNKALQKWNKNLENYEKFQNFHSCKLKIWIISDESGALWSRFEQDKNSQKMIASGLIPNFFQLISNNFNYQVTFQETKNDADVCLEIYRFETFLEHALHMTSTFMELRDVILATPGELYSPYEKLLLPFDDLTWKLLHFTFLIAFIVIFVINRLPKFIQNSVYGENVKSPTLNVISTFFGIAQIKIPNKFFPRFLLILFIFFCLIFRTCYQSKLFEFMTSEPRRLPPKTIEDMRDRNYTLYFLGTKGIGIFQKKINDEFWRWQVFKYFFLQYILNKTFQYKLQANV